MAHAAHLHAKADEEKERETQDRLKNLVLAVVLADLEVGAEEAVDAPAEFAPDEPGQNDDRDLGGRDDSNDKAR